MILSEPFVVSGAVEGLVDEAVLRRLLIRAGATPGTIFGKHGKSFLKNRIDAFNRAAQSDPWTVIVDLDHDAQCAVTMRSQWLPQPSRFMCFRIAVREIETWLIADAKRLAEFLSVKISAIPTDPESLGSPKRAMLAIAASSRRRDIRADMVPRSRSHRKVGPAYNSRLIEFVNNIKVGWRPDVAARSSESLRRCLVEMEELFGN